MPMAQFVNTIERGRASIGFDARPRAESNEACNAAFVGGPVALARSSEFAALCWQLGLIRVKLSEDRLSIGFPR
jgi:hypothetical protein